MATEANYMLGVKDNAAITAHICEFQQHFEVTIKIVAEYALVTKQKQEQNALERKKERKA